MAQLVDAFVDRNACTAGEDQDRYNEGPEIQLRPVTERMAFVRRLGGAAQPIKQQYLISGIDDGVDRFRQHRRTAGDERRAEL